MFLYEIFNTLKSFNRELRLRLVAKLGDFQNRLSQTCIICTDRAAAGLVMATMIIIEASKTGNAHFM